MTRNGNVVHIVGNLDVPATLRRIASEIESDPDPQKHHATLIINDTVYHMGTVDHARAAEQAVWNMTYGIHKIMGVVT